VDSLWDEGRASQLADDIDRLVYLSNLVGADPSLTQPGGGNTSIKGTHADFAGREAAALWVKGSGTDLRTLDRRGFARLRLHDLRLLRQRERMSDEEMMAFMSACGLAPGDPAPSVETPLHAILPYRCIVHTHDFATQALTDTGRPEALVREALGDEVAYVDYVPPGFPLARAVMALGPLGPAKGLVLARHGLVAWGETPRECYANLHRLIQRAEDCVARARRTEVFGPARAPTPDAGRRRALAGTLLPLLRGHLGLRRRVVLHYDDSPDVLRFVGSRRAAELAPRGMATPEHILRCGRFPLFVDADLAALAPAEAARVLGEAVDGYEREMREAHASRGRGRPMLDPIPRALLLPGLGLVTAMRDKRNALVGAQCYGHVIRVIEAAETLDRFRFLDDADAFEFEYWSLELAKLNQPERELSRRVAVVTGGASGIGRAVAERLAEEGAHVVLTDLDGEAARRAAEEIGKKVKDPSRVLGLRADATREAETAEAFLQTVLSFGGVDILFCNAGFVESGPFDRVSAESWARHFDVNLTGYFLSVREAVRIMKAQGGGTILLNASKAAFAAAAGNAAYASSKAGVAALARNLAVELAPSGIRVNYVNADFVDTPMMRRLIEQRAALKGIPPGRQEEEYRRRNLLHAGPIPPAAVAEAALFLVSDRSRYTTGGVLTVDAGLIDAMPR
jgi:rhamnulose-1-phosphate aldolase/alcohol dehydrogenase